MQTTGFNYFNSSCFLFFSNCPSHGAMTTFSGGQLGNQVTQMDLCKDAHNCHYCVILL